jgi:uncharacterized membrane protein YbhN (UPF0104 family)
LATGLINYWRANLGERLKAQAKKIVLWTARIVLAAVVIGFLFLSLQKIEWSRLAEDSLALHMSPLLYACLILPGLWLARALILWILVYHLGGIGFWRCFRVNTIGTAIDQVLPARSGYLFRWVAFTLRAPDSKAYIVAALMASVALEGAVLIALFLIDSLATQSALYIDSQMATILGAVVFFAGTFIFLSKPVDDWALRFFKGRLGFIHRFLLILPRLRRPEVSGTVLLASALAWLAQIFICQMIAESLGRELSLVQAMAALLVINLAIVIPITPGNLGTLQAAFIFILTKMGFSIEEALLFSVLFQIIHSVPTLVAGGLCGLWSSQAPGESLSLIWKRFRKEKIEQA